jgi:phosphoglycolate phosphatase
MATIPFDLVGFDLDGTLLDTSGDLLAAVNHVLGGIGRPPLTRAQLIPFIGRGAKVMLERALAATGRCGDDLIGQWLPVLFDHYAAHVAVHSTPYPGLLTALDSLAARGLRLAICTNKAERFASPLIKAMGLTDRFTAIIGGDTLGPGKAKPSPEPIRAMIAAAGGGRAIFLGDSTNDTAAARAAGIPSIACAFGFLDRPVEQLGADAVIGHYDELVPLLEGWRG